MDRPSRTQTTPSSHSIHKYPTVLPDRLPDFGTNVKVSCLLGSYLLDKPFDTRSFATHQLGLIGVVPGRFGCSIVRNPSGNPLNAPNPSFSCRSHQSDPLYCWSEQPLLIIARLWRLFATSSGHWGRFASRVALSSLCRIFSRSAGRHHLPCITKTLTPCTEHSRRRPREWH